MTGKNSVPMPQMIAMMSTVPHQLAEKLAILERVEQKPELILTSLKTSNANLLFWYDFMLDLNEARSENTSEQRKVLHRGMMSHLGEIGNRYVRLCDPSVWLCSDGKSNWALVHQGYSVLFLNVFTHSYERTVDTLRNLHASDTVFFQRQLAKLEQQIEQTKAIASDPDAYVVGRQFSGSAQALAVEAPAKLVQLEEERNRTMEILQTKRQNQEKLEPLFATFQQISDRWIERLRSYGYHEVKTLPIYE